MIDGETDLKRAIWLKSWGNSRCISDYTAGREEAPWSSSLHHLISVRIELCLSWPAALAILDFFLLFWSHLAYSIYLVLHLIQKFCTFWVIPCYMQRSRVLPIFLACGKDDNHSSFQVAAYFRKCWKCYLQIIPFPNTDIWQFECISWSCLQIILKVLWIPF